MGFFEWWKKSSAEASAAHYALRFDAREIAEMRGGLLNESAKAKLRRRFKGVGNINRMLLVGCGIPLGIFMVGAASLLGFVFFRALAARINPATVCFGTFFVIVIAVIVLSFIKMLFAVRNLKRATAEDLRSSRVAVATGKVDVVVRRSRNSFSIHYWIGAAEYEVINDALGSEIHRHFFGGDNITGQSSRQTAEVYNFYHLPESKYILHFEPA
jgi:hypothetical protein